MPARVECPVVFLPSVARPVPRGRGVSAEFFKGRQERGQVDEAVVPEVQAQPGVRGAPSGAISPSPKRRQGCGVPAGTIGRRSVECPGGKMVVFSYSRRRLILRKRIRACREHCSEKVLLEGI